MNTQSQTDPSQKSSLNLAFEAIVSIRSEVPEESMTAGLLGTERTGNGIRLREDGLIVTVGYLINEAETIWISSNDGCAVPGYIVGNDFRSGLALIKPMMPLAGSTVQVGDSSSLDIGDEVSTIFSQQNDSKVIKGHVLAKEEFAGRWEYVLDEAIFVAPPCENWSGAALINTKGELCGVGSLVIQGFHVNESKKTVNMFIPIDLLMPVINEICTKGRRIEPPRPWLGILLHDSSEELTVVGVYRDCPADKAGLRPGDIIIRVNDEPVHNLSYMFRTVWSLGNAGVDVPLMFLRNSKIQETTVKTAGRGEFLRKGTLQ